MPVDEQRLFQRLEQLAAVGRLPGGGVTRLALSDEDRAARDLLVQWLRSAGLDVRWDDGGNIVGWTRGGDQPAILVGSHIDSVRGGGRYDGALGVLGALGAVEAMCAQGHRHRLGVVAFTGEEGARFRPALLGSALATGAVPAEQVHATTDDAGLRFGEELRRIGYLGTEAERPAPVGAYLELHIEQGPVLERAGAQVGVVQGIQGIRWFEVTMHGRAAHAGTTPMGARRDALRAAAAAIGEVYGQLAQVAVDARVTIGRLHVYPDIVNVVPDTVRFSVDLRSRDEGALERGEQALRALSAGVAARFGCGAEVEGIWDSAAIRFDPRVMRAVAEAADALGASRLDLWAGASHDARQYAPCAATGMIFVPSRDGISHNQDEYTAPADCAAGAQVLLGALRRLDAENWPYGGGAAG